MAKQPITPERVRELLASARAQTSRQLAQELRNLEIVLEINRAQLDVSNLGITAENIYTEEAAETVANVIEAAATPPEITPIPLSQDAPVRKILGVARDDIVYNSLQQQFIDSGLAGKDVVLIGAAGTGKTTCQRGLGKALIASGRIPILGRSTKWLRETLPGIAVCSFTNKAVNTIRHALPEEIKPHALTIHKLLEFAPVFYEVEDPDNPGEFKKTMRFEPSRTRYNPLPSTLKLIIFEESSMIGYGLHDQLLDACPHKPQLIYLGDIQQLPPIFDSAILGFKMLELPVIELTEVYRQARNSPVIDLAWKLLEGDASIFNSRAKQYTATLPSGKEAKRIRIPALQALSRENEDGKVIFQPWQKQLSKENGLNTAVKQFNSWADSGYYNFDDDIILCPFNVSFGTLEINKGISQHLGRKRKATVHEVVAGYNKHYLAEGDRVLYAKEDAKILKIARNGEYLGKSFQPPSEYLDRWGYLRTEDMDKDALDEHKQHQQEEADEFDLEAIDKYLAAAAAETEERVTSASHIIDIELLATGEAVTLETASEVNALLGGYCITVHKAQGSEWDKVFLLMHHSHATMNQRELLYTAVTRAKRHLHIICEPSTFEKGIRSQKIKGNTLAEKAEEFKGKLQEREIALLAKAKVAAGQQDAMTIAFSMVPEWDSIAHDTVAHWWKIANKWWPEKLTSKKQPEFGWRIRGSSAGCATYGSNSITCSPVYLFIAPNDMISDTIPHEVAHIVSNHVYGDKGHGFGWKRVMEKFGRNAVESRCHNLGSLPSALRKILTDADNELKGKIEKDECE